MAQKGQSRLRAGEAKVSGMFTLRTISRLRPAALLFCGLATLALAQTRDVLPAGVTLPQHGSMYVLNVADKGPELTLMHATEVMSNAQAEPSFARNLVSAGPRVSVELNGAQSALCVEGKDLALLVRLNEDDPDLVRGRLTLVRLQQTERRRVLATFTQKIFGVQQKKEIEVVEVTKTDVPDGGWVKLTPKKPLEPGEYGLAVMPKDVKLFPDAVYDFEVKGAAASGK